MFIRSLLSCRRFSSEVVQLESLYQRARNYERLRDYEYCDLIEREIKKDNIMEAISIFNKSHLNNVVLDAQIYNNIFLKLRQLNYDISFIDVLYKQFRQHFSPMPLMLKMMETLASNGETHNTVRLDYEALNMQAPKILPRGRRHLQLKKPSEEQQQKIAEIMHRNRRQEILSHGQLTEDFQKMLSTLLNYQVKIEDLRMEFYQEPNPNNLYDSMNQSEEEAEEGSEDEELTLLDLLSNIKSIRIGKIEISNRKDQ